MVNNILNPSSITTDLKTKFIGHNILFYDSIASTNDIAKLAALKRCIEGTVVIAQEQTSGKCRLNSSWSTPKGTLALSVVLYPEINSLPRLIMVASLAVTRTISKIAGLSADIKWPNDVLIKGKKVCGILIENKLKGNRLEYSVIGIGLNVNLNSLTMSDFAPSITSLSDELNEQISLIEVTRRLLVEFELLYLNKEIIFEEWKRNLVTIGKSVHVTSGNNIYDGIAESVDVDGNLQLKLSNGNVVKIVAGDVTLRTH
jgi:BirA family biotin operon repressor/biotin-[acetyl-CoA-carboxylase] ligase